MPPCPADRAADHATGRADAAGGNGADGAGAGSGHGPADTGDVPGAAGAQGEAGLAATAWDWATIWQSEAAALATDRELHEAWGIGLVAASGVAAVFWPPVPGRDAAQTGPGRAQAERRLPGPMHRRGPRPLSLHLCAAAMTPGADTARDPGGGQGQGPDAGLVAGIAAYRRHPFQRVLPDPPCVWQEGDTRMLDYGAARSASQGACGPGTRVGGRVPVLFVPSLVNRAQVLDLLPGRSLLRWLASQGVHPLLLDWGWPGEVEHRFGLTDYVAGRLERAVAELGQPVILAGYCMGGLLCTAFAARRPELVTALALLATPWDFHAADIAGAGAGPPSGSGSADGAPGPSWVPEAVVRMLALLEPAMALTGVLGVDALQMLFELAAPGAVAAKYRSFGRTAPDSDRARCFVAIEDWLADGVPLAAPVARECLGEWYGANSPARGEWRVAGLPVVPEALRLPSLVVVPMQDRIVPAGSALALGRLIPGSTVLRPAAGHVGMIVGSRAEAGLWEPLRDWLRQNGG